MKSKTFKGDNRKEGLAHSLFGLMCIKLMEVARSSQNGSGPIGGPLINLWQYH